MVTEYGPTFGNFTWPLKHEVKVIVNLNLDQWQGGTCVHLVIKSGNDFMLTPTNMHK
jgi:hypothetical protein